MREVDNKWFFSELPFFVKMFTFYIKGDLIVLFPLLLIIILLGILSLKFMLLMVGTYIVVRNLGEMIYWIFHQFSSRSYRPNDFGFKRLDNHAIYILMQTLAIAGVMLGLAIVFAVLLFFR